MLIRAALYAKHSRTTAAACARDGVQDPFPWHLAGAKAHPSPINSNKCKQTHMGLARPCISNNHFSHIFSSQTYTTFSLFSFFLTACMCNFKFTVTRMFFSRVSHTCCVQLPGNETRGYNVYVPSMQRCMLLRGRGKLFV